MTNIDDLSAQTDEMKRQAKEALHKAGDHFSEQANRVRDLAADARYNTEDFIQTNPWQAVAVAAGVGFVVGVLLARR